MPAPAAEAAAASKCPVGLGGSDKVFLEQAAGTAAAAAAAAAASTSAGQLAQHDAPATDPRNNMPKVAEQKPWPGQRIPLNTHRVESVIPKAEFTPEHQTRVRESSSWMYPSEQQFYNAMKRKGWQPREEDMKIVVSIHNHVNDRAWSHVMRYEELHAGECECPRLKRFMGKPKELSPKATLRSYLGYALPFDRHDWIVDRCGKEVRYIIDFYQGPPPPQGSGAAVSMFLDARPALDSWEALADRVRLQFNDTFKTWMPPRPAAPPAAS
jgi:cytochrome c heme-lyase